MPRILSQWFDRQSIPTAWAGGNEHTDLRVDDPPPEDHPSERYSAWQASAIYDLKPFSSPTIR